VIVSTVFCRYDAAAQSSLGLTRASDMNIVDQAVKGVQASKSSAQLLQQSTEYQVHQKLSSSIFPSNDSHYYFLKEDHRENFQ
jgi:hypothetical protein